MKKTLQPEEKKEAEGEQAPRFRETDHYSACRTDERRKNITEGFIKPESKGAYLISGFAFYSIENTKILTEGINYSRINIKYFYSWFSAFVDYVV